jgi:hypothetical protein
MEPLQVKRWLGPHRAPDETERLPPAGRGEAATNPAQESTDTERKV